MVFSRFRFQIIGRILLLCVTIFFLIYTAVRPDKIMIAFLCGALTIYQITALIRYIDKTNRDLTLFLQSINHDDFSVTFDSRKYGSSFKDLEKSFTEVTKRFLQIRSEKEENFRYLQTVVQHVGTSLISFKPDGEVELINSSAKRLLNINHLKNIKSLEKISKPLTATLLKLRPGENVLLEVEIDERKLFLSINATQFKLQATAFTLVSLQDIQSEIEREKMATELSIAYQVQKSLLPRSNPKLTNFDIAGLCIPAKEVGGDYYDYIPIGNKKLGLVIADVSGKGVPAAIYMTLTKGIIQSHTHDHISAKDVLIKANQLLYKTMEKGSFVSMFFAILDDEAKKITCARAGHNEAFFYSSSLKKIETVQPKGIGLGLEKGEIFQQEIQEQELHFQKGDLLIFYTDGFTEAMNSQKELFGEERLKSALLENHEYPMHNIIFSVSDRVKEFTDNHSQYDDMTMIGIKGI